MPAGSARLCVRSGGFEGGEDTAGGPEGVLQFLAYSALTPQSLNRSHVDHGSTWHSCQSKALWHKDTSRSDLKNEVPVSVSGIAASNEGPREPQGPSSYHSDIKRELDCLSPSPKMEAQEKLTQHPSYSCLFLFAFIF